MNIKKKLYKHLCLLLLLLLRLFFFLLLLSIASTLAHLRIKCTYIYTFSSIAIKVNILHTPWAHEEHIDPRRGSLAISMIAHDLKMYRGKQYIDAPSQLSLRPKIEEGMHRASLSSFIVLFLPPNDSEIRGYRKSKSKVRGVQTFSSWFLYLT